MPITIFFFGGGGYWSMFGGVRTPLHTERKQEMTEHYINFVTEHSVPKPMTLKEILDATNADAALTKLRDAIKTNKWDSPTVKPFKEVKN